MSEGPDDRRIVPAKRAKKFRDADDYHQSSHAPDRYRMLPASDIAERGVVCSILLAPPECIGLCDETGVLPCWFHNPSLATIFGILGRMHDETKKIDNVTLTQRLADEKLLDQIGGAALIAELFTYLPTATNVKYYITILREKWILRQMITVATEFASLSYEEQNEPEKLLSEFEQAVLAIESGNARAKVATAKEAVMEAMVAIQDKYDRRGSITGISTGFPDLDRITDGLHDAEMIVIAARPSQGKTALAMNMAEHIAVTLGLPVAVFSLEMTKSQLMQRMICSRAKVNLKRVSDGHLSERDFPSLTAAASQLAEAPMFFDESSDLSIQELRGRARRLKKEHGIRAIFVDYLQLLKSTSKKSQENRQLEVAEVSGGLKACAKELGVPIVVLAQIGRDFERRGPQARPRLADLRESGAIEQDADVVHFIVRAETYAETDQERMELMGQAEIIVAKQRSGPTGDVPLTFLKEFTRFETRATTHDDEADAAAAQTEMQYPE